MDAIFVFRCFALIILTPLLIKLVLTSTVVNNNNKKKKKQRFPPSPPSLPILGHLHHLNKPLHQSLAQISALHGPILLLRFGIRPVLVVSSAPLADECFTTNDLAFANRPKFPSNRLTTYDHTSLGVAAYGPEWRDMRRISSIELLSRHRLAFFSDVRADEARSLSRRLFHDLTSDHKEFAKVDLRPRLLGLAMNVMTRMMVGKRYYGQESGDGDARRFMEIVEEIFTLSGASNVGDFLPSVLGWFALRRVNSRLAQIHGFRDTFLQALIEERRWKRKVEVEEEGGLEEEKRNDDTTMIDALLSLQKAHPEQYDDRYIKSLFASLLSAGTDTSSNTIEWAMSLLLNNPEKLEKVREEIDDKVGSDCLLNESDIAKLPYLHCVINETLRMYPAGPLLVPHESLDECKVGGYNIPSGTMLLVNAYVIQRDPKMWPEPAKFIPERFLDQDTKVDGGKFLPFGMGRRRCPGEGLAIREMGLVLGTLVQCFEWRRVGLEEVGMKEGSGLTMPKANPLKALCRPSQTMIATLSQL